MIEIHSKYDRNSDMVYITIVPNMHLIICSACIPTVKKVER